MTNQTNQWEVFYLVDGLTMAVPQVKLEQHVSLEQHADSPELDALLVEFGPDLPNVWGVDPRVILWAHVASASGAMMTPEDFAVLDSLLDALHVFGSGFPQVVARCKVLLAPWRTLANKRKVREPGQYVDLGDLGEDNYRAQLLPHTAYQPEELRMDLSEQDCSRLRAFWAKWKGLDKSLVREAIDALKRASTGTPEGRVTGLVQCLESLLSEGPGDLKYKVATRGACLLEPSSADRRRLLEFLKKAYDVRCDVVHGKPGRDTQRDVAALERIAGQPLDAVLPVFETRARDLVRRFAVAVQVDRTEFLARVDTAIVAGKGLHSLFKAAG